MASSGGGAHPPPAPTTTTKPSSSDLQQQQQQQQQLRSRVFSEGEATRDPSLSSAQTPDIVSDLQAAGMRKRSRADMEPTPATTTTTTTVAEALKKANLEAEADKQVFQSNVQVLVVELLASKQEADRLRRENAAWQEEYLKMKSYNDIVLKLLQPQAQQAAAALKTTTQLQTLSNLLAGQHQQQQGALMQVLSAALGKEAGAAILSSLGPPTPTERQGATQSQSKSPHSTLQLPATPSMVLGQNPPNAHPSALADVNQQQFNRLIQTMQQQGTKMKQTLALAGHPAGDLGLRELGDHLMVGRPAVGAVIKADPASSSSQQAQAQALQALTTTETALGPLTIKGTLKGKRNRGMNLPRQSVRRLKEFLYDRFDNPYPSEAQKIKLSQDLGLETAQVNTWFINARMRLWKPVVEQIFSEMKERVESKLGGIKADKEGSGGKAEEEASYKALLDKYQKVQEAEDPRTKVAFMITDEWAEKKMQEKRMDLRRELACEVEVRGERDPQVRELCAPTVPHGEGP